MNLETVIATIFVISLFVLFMLWLFDLLERVIDYIENVILKPENIPIIILAIILAVTLAVAIIATLWYHNLPNYPNLTESLNNTTNFLNEANKYVGEFR